MVCGSFSTPAFCNPRTGFYYYLQCFVILEPAPWRFVIIELDFGSGPIPPPQHDFLISVLLPQENKGTRMWGRPLYISRKTTHPHPNTTPCLLHPHTSESRSPHPLLPTQRRSDGFGAAQKLRGKLKKTKKTKLVLGNRAKPSKKTPPKKTNDISEIRVSACMHLPALHL